LRYRLTGAPGFETAPLSELGGNQFEALLPGGNCDETIEFYLEAEGDLGGVARFPRTAPTKVLTAVVGTEQLALADDFDTDLGWAATSTAGTTDGFWERGVPVDDPAWAYDPPADADGSGHCYMTRNLAGNSDLDNGTVTLTSPSFDMTSGDMQIEYEYFLRLTDASGVDRIAVEISSDGDAGPWTQVASHATDAGTVWRHETITAAELAGAGVALTGDMRLRFRANDSNPQSIVEAAIDAVRIARTECVQPACPGDTDGDDDVDLDDLLVVLGTFGQSGAGLAGDVDDDDDVDLDDLLVVLGVFGAPCEL
jgi:hypothetical protein